jgi:hypothetical protein
MNFAQQRFQGYQQTPLLWKDELLGLQQFQMPRLVSFALNHDVDYKLRLGNYVERLVSHELLQDNSIDILKENVQIIANKTTLGELDCLLLKNQQAIHLEIAYKFYLYDPTVGDSFLEHWIGPNRRDSLLLKLHKIKEKQFPLLYSEECQLLLEELQLNAKDILQQTFFKAQLYLPFQTEIPSQDFNSGCFYGYYIRRQQLNLFADAKFYIPRKLDWLITPHTQVDWMNVEAARDRISEFHQKNSAPLCWIKQPNGEIHKVFVVWWNY